MLSASSQRGWWNLSAMSHGWTRRPGGTERRKTSPAIWTMVALFVGFVGFLGLAVLAHDVRHGTALDHNVLGWMIEHRSEGLTTAALVVTNAGSPGAMALLAMLASVILWWRRRTPLPGLVVIAPRAVASGSSTLTKAVVGAQRPPRHVQLLLEVDPSFPSGHVTGTLALVGIVAVVIGYG